MWVNLRMIGRTIEVLHSLNDLRRFEEKDFQGKIGRQQREKARARMLAGSPFCREIV
jgi:hypothetical protein